MIGTDTSFLIDFLRGEKNAVEWMDKHKENLYLCENVVYEFLCGDLTEEERETFLGFVSQFPVFGFDRSAALKSAEVHREAKDKGVQVPHPDAMIAGTYAAHQVDKIVTGDPEHFEKITTVTTIRY